MPFDSYADLSIRTVNAIRYVTPLKEGGSLPAIVEADDDGTYVLKFRGAGQGPKALIAELIAGEIGRALGLHIPEIVFMELSAELGRTERDPEINSLIKASVGLNLAVDYLPGALGFDALDVGGIDPETASGIVWFDAFMTNVDRTVRNTNMLWWKNQLWLIDHGAGLYFHHNWDDHLTRAKSPFAQVREHILLRRAATLDAADAHARKQLTVQRLEQIIAPVPDAWLEAEPGEPPPMEQRKAYLEYLSARLEASHNFVEEAQRARAKLL